jgi:hypothetical protein
MIFMSRAIANLLKNLLSQVNNDPIISDPLPNMVQVLPKLSETSFSAIKREYPPVLAYLWKL